jgi:YHS domain-containing protein
MKRFTLLLLPAGWLLAGCSALPPPPPDNAPIAQCCVCRHNRDFSCLEVRKTPTTPRATVDGHTYYFCSEACRDDFLHHTQRYK